MYPRRLEDRLESCPLKLELQRVVSCPMWVLGIELMLFKVQYTIFTASHFTAHKLIFLKITFKIFEIPIQYCSFQFKSSYFINCCYKYMCLFVYLSICEHNLLSLHVNFYVFCQNWPFHIGFPVGVILLLRREYFYH